MGATTLGGSAAEAATSGGSAVDAAASGGSGAEAATSGGDSWIGEASGEQCAAHMHKMATTITESTEVRGTVSVTASAEALRMPAARTDISGGSITLEISPGQSFASAGAWVL